MKKILVYFVLFFSIFNLSCKKETSEEIPDYEPKNIYIKFELGMAYLNLNKWEDAEREFKEILNLNSNIVSCYFNLGSIYLNAGNKNKAIQFFKKGLELDPSNESVKELLKKIE